MRNIFKGVAFFLMGAFCLICAALVIVSYIGMDLTAAELIFNCVELCVVSVVGTTLAHRGIEMMRRK